MKSRMLPTSRMRHRTIMLVRWPGTGFNHPAASCSEQFDIVAQFVMAGERIGRLYMSTDDSAAGTEYDEEPLMELSPPY